MPTPPSTGPLPLALAIAIAPASWCAVPDSLLPPGGFKPDRAPSDPEAAMHFGQGLMAAGAGAIVVGGIVAVVELTRSIDASADCELGKDADACSSSEREPSRLGPGLVVAGLVALPLGALIAAAGRDDSGRNPKYYGSIGPGRIEAGFRQRF